MLVVDQANPAGPSVTVAVTGSYPEACTVTTVLPDAASP